VLAGGVEAFGLADADLALVCASHAGRPEQVERCRGLLARGGLAPEDLACGAHPPLDEGAARELARRGEEPSPLHNNCSGKHAGMLLACLRLGHPREGYLEPDHPLQRRILGHLARFAGLGAEEIGVAVDGCGAPTFHLPLAAAARAYAALVAPDLAAGVDGAEAAAAGRVVRAMTGAPAMVAGPGRFTTRLMEATGGRLLAKEGFEGFLAVGVRGPVALGLAVKIADGGERARGAVVIELLRQVGCLAAAEAAALEDLHRPRLRNWRGLPVGEIAVDCELEEGWVH
jgi:L-asparaginase II